MRKHVISGVLIVLIAAVFAAFDQRRTAAAATDWSAVDRDIQKAAKLADAQTADAGPRTPHILDGSTIATAYLRVECSAEPDTAAKLEPYLRAKDIHKGTHLRCYRSDGVSW
jgi:hypothetical protein